MDEVIKRVEDWLAGMRVDRPLVLTNQQYADLWQLVSIAKSLDRIKDQSHPD